MYKLACKSLGAVDCNFVATGESKDEAVDKMKEHAEASHPDALAGKSEYEIVRDMEGAVVEE